MKRVWYLGVPLIVALILCATVAFAQDEDIDQMIHTVASTPSQGVLFIKTLLWMVMYLPFYTVALLLPLWYLRLFNCFDADMLLWIGLTWFGGIVISFISHSLFSNNVLAVTIALPLIFGWTLFLSTRSFADLLMKDAWRVALVVALLCAPYTGPWRIQRPKVPDMQQSQVFQLNHPHIAVMSDVIAHPSVKRNL